VISPDKRNLHLRADSVVVVPLSTSVHKDEVPWHFILEPAQTGLDERTVAQAENVTTVRKEALQEPHRSTRTQSSSAVSKLIGMVNMALTLER
jgi:mRNA-degrading endonuclease toxin of MazEF toxin-antitoxin module